MFSVLISMAFIMLIGVAWRSFLGVESAMQIRAHLVRAVYQIFLPALVLSVMWRTALDWNAVRIPVVAIAVVLGGLATAWCCYVVLPWLRRALDRPVLGALLLASGFGNFTYLGLPVLSQSFGADYQFVAIYFDFFAATPLLFSIGIMIALHFGTRVQEQTNTWQALLRVPALWAALAGVLLSAMNVPMPAWLQQSLEMLAAAVVPLMLLSVGMALRWRRGWAQRLPILLPVAAIQLFCMPWLAWMMVERIGLASSLVAPVVIEAAMPSMVLGLVLCDRFGLSTETYAEAVTVTTVLSLASLPLWLLWLG